MEKEKEKESSSASKDRIVPVNPTPFIKSLIGKQIVVKLKWGMEYCGLLSCADAYMNLQLREAEEYVDGCSHGNMPKLVIRCNNILYIKEKESAVVEKPED